MAATNPTMATVEAARPKKGPKVVSHLEIHPALGGGHTVKHVYSGYAHEPREYHFKEGEDGRLSEHLHRHLGLKPVKGEGSMHKNEESIDHDEE